MRVTEADFREVRGRPDGCEHAFLRLREAPQPAARSYREKEAQCEENCEAICLGSSAWGTSNSGRGRHFSGNQPTNPRFLLCFKISRINCCTSGARGRCIESRIRHGYSPNTRKRTRTHAKTSLWEQSAAPTLKDQGWQQLDHFEKAGVSSGQPRRCD